MVVTKNLGRYVPFGLSKTGSSEQIFAKICVSGAKNLQKLVFKYMIFSKNPSGVSNAVKRQKGLKRWVSRAKIWPEKWVLRAACRIFQCLDFMC